MLLISLPEDFQQFTPQSVCSPSTSAQWNVKKQKCIHKFWFKAGNTRGVKRRQTTFKCHEVIVRVRAADITITQEKNNWAEEKLVQNFKVFFKVNQTRGPIYTGWESLTVWLRTDALLLQEMFSSCLLLPKWVLWKKETLKIKKIRNCIHSSLIRCPCEHCSQFRVLVQYLKNIYIIFHFSF